MIMKIDIIRIFNCPNYCIGHLYIDGAYFCDTIEDTDRMLTSDMTEQQILKIKVKDKTAIPTGNYNIIMNMISPRFSKKEYYKKFCNGKLPRLDYVKGFSGVLIHIGNTEKDSSGCILVGYNKIKGQLINSRIAFENLYNKIKMVYEYGGKITLNIERKY